jgi:hypothetical protein
MGVNRRTSNVGAKAELGPLSATHFHILSFTQKHAQKSNNSLLKAAYDNDMNLSSSTSIHKSTVAILDLINENFKTDYNINSIVTEITTSHESIYKDNFHSALNNDKRIKSNPKNKLRTYRTFKLEIGHSS